MKKMTPLLIASLIGGCIFLGACAGKNDQQEPVQILLEAENHVSSSTAFPVKELNTGETVVEIPGGGWLAFDVDVPVPGRYRTEIRVSTGKATGLTCWIEDYYDNKDGRTYNITGNMVCFPSGTGQLVSVSKDGSPMNKGKHPLKFHADSGGAIVDYIKFTLIKEHQLTPDTLIQQTEGSDWVVAWADEFDHGSTPDTSKWTYDIGNWGWGNFELQYYTEHRPENARIENGNLIIEARKNDMGQEWTSARLTTRGKTTFIYGKIEIRARVPAQRGNWAAGWTLGDEYVDELSWPYCGEIDILESVGYEIDDQTGNGQAHASVHCGAYYFKLNNHPTSILPVENMTGEFHTYAVEWSPDAIKAYVDGQHYFTFDDTSSNLSWPFDKPQNLILNLAMGGGWGGLMGMDENMTGQQYIIDYVRVYERR